MSSRAKNILPTKKVRCACCGCIADELEDDWLDTGYQTLKETYAGGSVQHAHDSFFYVDLSSMRIVFEFGPNEMWRVHEVWFEVPHMTIHFDGSPIWKGDPTEAIKAIFDKKRSSYDWAPEKNP